ncbi:MAG: aminotransferase class I/II-fold pyridoxal phosphate-dependent enzyme [Promethearchaeota archaeon]
MGSTNIEFAERVKKVPKYIFVEIEELLKVRKKRGEMIIPLSIGDPDLPPPQFVVDSLIQEVKNPSNHKYPTSEGDREFREAVTNWYRDRFGVNLNPETEATALIGSKEGLSNVIRAFINPGDRVLVPDPSYPVYAQGGAILSDGVPVFAPLYEDDEFRPDFSEIDPKGAKMIILNYPNNPTGATADISFLNRAVEYALENNLILAYDNAYSEITFDGYNAPSILEIGDAKDVAIEFNSCSKTFNMTGDRIGFAVGNKKIISGLKKVKSQIDSGAPTFIQKAARMALESYKSGQPPRFVEITRQTYKERRDVLVKRLREIGFSLKKPKGTFYVWVNVNRESIEFTRRMIDVGVVVTPGEAFGNYSRSYVRFALTRPKSEIEEACNRIERVLENDPN